MVGFKTRAFIPSIPSDPAAFKKEMTKRASQTAKQIRRDFAKTTRTWKTDVKFDISQKRSGDGYIFSAHTDNEIYGYVNNGTKPHPIVAKNAPYLVFTYPSTPKTQPNILRSRKGSRGKNWAKRKSVKHPGNKPRNFDKIISERFKERWVREANEALRSYLQTSTRPAGRFR